MLNTEEKIYLRGMAKKVRELSQQPIQQERIQRWKNLNALKKGRPLIVVALPIQVIDMLIPDNSLRLQNEPLFKWIEWSLKLRLYHAEHFPDDEPVISTLHIGINQEVTDWMEGHKRVQMSRDGKASFFEPCITEFSDIRKMRMPELSIDWESSNRDYECTRELLGDILDVRQGNPFRSSIGWGESMIDELVEMRGLENVYTDLHDNPGFIHEIMEFMTEGHLHLLDQYEKQGVMFLNNEQTTMGSTSFGYTDELPGIPYNEEQVTRENLWGYGQAQEFSEVSAAMLEEFVLPYQARTLQRFGLTSYGCCEALDKKFKVIKKTIPNLRMFSISPFTNHEIAADEIKGNYVYCWKPNPSIFVGSNFNETAVAEDLERVFRITRDCCVSVFLEDQYDFNQDIRRIGRWVEIAKEKAEKYE